MRTLISLEKLKSEIYLQDLHLKKYEIQLSNLDANMITYFTANYENNICDNLIELCERETDDSKNSEKDWKGRNRLNQQRKKKNSDCGSRSISNNQHNSHKLSTNKPIKNDKKMAYTS